MALSRRTTDEANGILGAVLDGMLLVSPGVGRAGSNVRRMVGDLRVAGETAIHDGDLGTRLLACFEAVRLAGATFDDIEQLRRLVVRQRPVSRYAIILAVSCLVFCLVQQAKLVTAMTFVSRSDVDVVMARVRKIFDATKLAVADYMAGAPYQAVVHLHAQLVQHLSATELLLPRIVTLTMASGMPALALANRIYGDGSRSDELIDENRIVHPAFCPRIIMALSE